MEGSISTGMIVFTLGCVLLGGFHMLSKKTQERFVKWVNSL